MQFKIIHNTWAKKTTVNSSELTDKEKSRFESGWQGQGEIVEFKNNHTRIKLDYWFFNEHIAVQDFIEDIGINEDPEQLSQNFHLSEFTRSETASRLRLDNTPGETEIENLRMLCQNVLQPIRDYYNKPVIVTSGYRSKAVNNAVGGSTTSQHVQGQAADFTVSGIDNYTLASWIKNNLDYDQLILEYYEGGNTGWIHVGYSSRHLNQELTINRHGTFNGLKRY